MSKKDVSVGLVAGLVIGVFLIPTAKNIGLFAKIPSPYLMLLVVLPILACLGVAVVGFIGRWMPIFWQVAKFGLVGVMNTAVNLGIYNTLIAATGYNKGTPLMIIFLIAFVFAVINSYFWNKHWVFGGIQSKNREETLQFFAVTIVTAIVSSLIIKAVTEYIAPIGGLNAAQWANVANGFAIITSFIMNFFGYKLIVFRPRA
ncbi:MAG: hypothetical protein A3C11_01445 [Candidatus Sungbacteria bacterium RIFCSPHIGHO2_02_FULL_49_12]|uniref:GtrA/DPMS transmembrane domain-containing protein n=1 Tax=Candidatus Sungbacteria bacterium RIFCSPHIGHO2_02_FULL_49_12 TaxID=1802271 RepID=A0A1G2KR15_9BACT|nr:MAG: hypothetical protein A3C11_01445 [Candidatus Sungbacteria bacterium RIFCSPHIGHO2_02_FULL_49_12]